MEPKANRTNASYRRILKSTTIMGGSSGFNIILRIIRIKFLAILLGPSGMGLLGIYTSITDLGGAVARMGIDNSGVRQIAEAAATGNEEKLGHTLFTLRRVSLLFGVAGMIVLILLSSPISRLTFGNTEYASAVVFLSVIILFDTIMNREVALIQGMRKIGDLAKLNVLGALMGTILGIPILYVWGQKGIVPFLVAASAMSIFAAWWYARKIKVPRVQMGWAEIRTESKPLLRLGSVFMAGDLMGKGTMWLLRVLVARGMGLQAVGLWQASMALSYVYVGFILDSMGKDYYPRLTAIAGDDVAFNDLVNQQVEIGTLLSLPGILATLTFAPIIIQLFYTAKFIAAFEILHWQILGVPLLVAGWPMKFILQAKGQGRMFLLTEFLSNVVYVGLIWAGIYYFGLKGTGIAFLGVCFFYLIIIYGVAKHLTGFTWSEANIRNALLIVPAMGIVFVSGWVFEGFGYLILGSTISLAMAFYSIKRLVGIISPDGLGPFLVEIKDRFWGGIFDKAGKKS